MRRTNAFTLVELMIVIVLLSILTALVIPRFRSYRDSAEEAAEQSIVKNVRAGIQTYYANHVSMGEPTFPTTLDEAQPGSKASGNNPFFDKVVEVPLKRDWTKGGDINTYISTRGNTFTYDPNTGAFK